MKRALIFGLNYTGTPGALRGCINDATNMGGCLSSLGYSCITITDDVDWAGCTRLGIYQSLYSLSLRTHTETIPSIWVHFSGHGTWRHDASGDEVDRQDEGLVPADGGTIFDDSLYRWLTTVSPRTEVVLTFDCCHAGTMGDLPLTWDGTGMRTTAVARGIAAKVVCISGSSDAGTAIDTLIQGQYQGVFTRSLIDSIDTSDSWFDIVVEVHRRMSLLTREQTVRLSSTFELQ